MHRILFINIIFAYLLLFFSCSHQQPQNPVLLQVETIMEAHPDSALALLKAISSPQNMSEADRAKYALLMAAVTDKNELPLLPCDSLIDFAIDYYDDNEKEMAVALLYKGRLQGDMGDVRSAIKNNLKALEILEEYPKEIHNRRLIYSALGVWYNNIKAYDKAIEMQEQALQYSQAGKDSSYALNNLSVIFGMKERKDSTIIYLRQALKTAINSKDSDLITSRLNNLASFFHYYEEYDSAMNYAHKTLRQMPAQYKDRSNCYYSLGDIYLSMKQYDSATYYLNKSSAEPNIKKKVIIYRTLSYLEEQLKHYENAYHYMEEYVDINDSITDASQVSETQHLIYQHQTELEVQKEQQKAFQILSIVISGFIIICLFIILLYQKRLNYRKRLQLLRERALEELRYKLSFVQKTIEENETVIHLLHESQENKKEEIQQRERTIEQLKQEKLKLRIWLLEQSTIYKKVLALAHQEAAEKKELQVLKTTELVKLRQVVFEIYADYIKELQSNDFPLTEDDLLYLCLRLTDLSSLTIARCFGYTNTQPINQRKFRLKEKMKQHHEQML